MDKIKVLEEEVQQLKQRIDDADEEAGDCMGLTGLYISDVLRGK